MLQKEFCAVGSLVSLPFQFEIPVLSGGKELINIERELAKLQFIVQK